MAWGSQNEVQKNPQKMAFCDFDGHLHIKIVFLDINFFSIPLENYLKLKLTGSRILKSVKVKLPNEALFNELKVLFKFFSKEFCLT